MAYASQNWVKNLLSNVLKKAKDDGMLGGKEVKLANDDTKTIKFGIDANGNWGYIKAGADTVTPFKTGSGEIINPSLSELWAFYYASGTYYHKASLFGDYNGSTASGAGTRSLNSISSTVASGTNITIKILKHCILTLKTDNNFVYELKEFFPGDTFEINRKVTGTHYSYIFVSEIQ